MKGKKRRLEGWERPQKKKSTPRNKEVRKLKRSQPDEQ